MKQVIGTIFKILGFIVFIIAGIWGLFIEIAIVNQMLGFLGIVVGFILFPVMFAITPIYAGVVWGNWSLLVLVYGGGITAAVLWGIGAAITGEN